MPLWSQAMESRARTPAPFVQTVAGAVVVAVHYAHNVAPGVVFQLLGRAAGGLDMDAVARKVIGEGCAGLDGIELLQLAVISVCLRPFLLDISAHYL